MTRKLYAAFEIATFALIAVTFSVGMVDIVKPDAPVNAAAARVQKLEPIVITAIRAPHVDSRAQPSGVL